MVDIEVQRNELTNHENDTNNNGNYNVCEATMIIGEEKIGYCIYGVGNIKIIFICGGVGKYLFIFVSIKI